MENNRSLKHYDIEEDECIHIVTGPLEEAITIKK